MQLAGLLDDDLAPRRRRPQPGAEARPGGRGAARWSAAGARTRSSRPTSTSCRSAARSSASTPLRAALFGKAPHGLDAREAAIAAALVRAPERQAGAGGAARLRRARWSRSGSRLRRRIDMFASAALAAARRVPIRASSSRRTSRAQRRCRHARRGRPSAATARRAAAALRASTRCAATCASCAGATSRTARVVVLDNAQRRRAGLGRLERRALPARREVDGVLAPRQPGSTLKPFLYALALERAPAHRRPRCSTTRRRRSPPPAASTCRRTTTTQFKGCVSVRTALGALAQRAGGAHAGAWSAPTPSHARLRALGFAPDARAADYYGSSLALGSADVTLLALTNAYRTLANGGRYGAAPRCAPASAPQANRQRVIDAARRLHRRRHPRRPRTRARAPSASTACSRRALLERGEDRHQQGHARQLVRRLHASATRSASGSATPAARRCRT